MIKIYIKPEELWRYFQKHRKRLENTMDNIAEVFDDGAEIPLYRIYLTEDKGNASMTIEQVYDDEEEIIFKECAISEQDCITVYHKFIQQFKRYDGLEIVEERELQLKEALVTFLNVLLDVCDCKEIMYDGELSDILDSIESMMCQEFGYLIYRPQIIECDRQIKLIEFPYEECDPYGNDN